jgi:hypothetical protein
MSARSASTSIPPHSCNDVGRITDVRRDDLDVVTPAEVELSCE